MVHLHRPLGQRVQWESVAIDPGFLERHVPERQWIEIGRNPRPVRLWRAYLSMALSGEAKTLQRLDVELQHDGLRPVDQSHRDGGFEVGLVRVLEIELI